MKFISRGLSTSAEFTKEVYAILSKYYLRQNAKKEE